MISYTGESVVHSQLDRIFDNSQFFNNVVKWGSYYSNYGGFFEKLENPFKFSWNKKGTSYWEVTKNSFEIGAGYTFSNDHPLSVNPSQVIYKVTPLEFSVRYNDGNAMIIGKPGSIPTTTWYTNHVFNNGNFFHEYSTGDMTLNDGDINVESGDINIKGNNQDLNITGQDSGIKITKGGIDIDNGYVDIKGNLEVIGSNRTFTISGTNSIINANKNNVSSLTADNTFLNGPWNTKKRIITETTINCSTGNYFEFTTTVNSQNFTFSDVPNEYYQCVLKCQGNVKTTNFPVSVKWSRRSFYTRYSEESQSYDYIVVEDNNPDISDETSDDIHIITFKTFDGGVTWYADDEKYET
jgi:hypothetical protein